MFLNSIKTAVIILSLIVGFNVYGQNGKIKFEKTTHDYGKLRQEDKRATYRFVFTNIGTGDLKILKVKPGCGCTSSNYTRTIVKPGEKGFIEATYHTVNRPGPFRKTIAVTTNDADKPTVILTIKGVVNQKPKTPADRYPIGMGNLKMMTNHIYMGAMKNTDIKTDTLEIYNNWGQQMDITFQQVPEHISIQAVPANLPPKTKGKLIVTFDASKANDFDLVNSHVVIRTNDALQPVKSLSVSARISQDFSALSEKELKKAPVAKFDTTLYDFGQLTSGSVVEYDFVLNNNGKSDLKILKVKTDCGCTASTPESTVIKKKKSTKIHVKFDTGGRTGFQKKQVTVITNDPNNPIIVLVVQGTLVKKE